MKGFLRKGEAFFPIFHHYIYSFNMPGNAPAFVKIIVL
jgi:hypothetical protein